MELPDWDNFLANVLLNNLLARECEVELAKLDFSAYALLTSLGVKDKKEFEAKVDTFGKIREAAKEVISGAIFNPAALKKREDEIKQKREEDARLLSKLNEL